MQISRCAFHRFALKTLCEPRPRTQSQSFATVISATVMSNKVAFYAVAKGRAPGVYMTWDECREQTTGFPAARFKKLRSAAEAEEYLARFGIKWTLPEETTPTPAPFQRAIENKVESPADDGGCTIVYCDGACKGNGQAESVAGIGVWWGRSDPRNLAERCPGSQTNNRAELIAIVRVLETAPHNKNPLIIKTDSQYSIKCLRTWLPKWLDNGFKTAKGDPVKNVQLIYYLNALLAQRALEGQKVHLEYVRGHAGEEGNEGADALANIGAYKPTVPERDWEALQAQLSNTDHADSNAMKAAVQDVVSAETSAEVPMDEEELQAYANCLLPDEDIELDLLDDYN
ncbi:ribonuclease H-like protein [Laetiporus sulphureus 93-53]|uniref:ribonuclease H n=1 Tax=Laetiporus sulphureus 93-53 TaxID=1314785 RepID=A0A165C821_9APHY|nr:ribonuclease H-like protein [Laetiporus sulphureus 93-53]KZT02364.1 ribonuclease H-like protein [Laetiporus sulphureus 93-53]